MNISSEKNCENANHFENLKNINNNLLINENITNDFESNVNLDSKICNELKPNAIPTDILSPCFKQVVYCSNNEIDDTSSNETDNPISNNLNNNQIQDKNTADIQYMRLDSSNLCKLPSN